MSGTSLGGEESDEERVQYLDACDAEGTGSAHRTNSARREKTTKFRSLFQQRKYRGDVCWMLSWCTVTPVKDLIIDFNFM